MKKGTIIALIVAAALIITGGMILVLGLSFAGGTVDSVTTVTESTHTVTETFDKILIDTGDCDVTIVPFNGTIDPYVVLRERAATRHSVLVEEGTLKIKMIDERKWTDFVGVNWESMEMTVYLPEREYASVRITTSTGDIKIPEPFSGKAIQLQSDTGEIYCNGRVSDLLSVMTDTGDIQVSRCAPAMLQLASNTGEIRLQKAEGTEFHLENDTGDTELENVVCKSLTCKASTGEVNLEWVMAEDYLQIFTDTGDVEIEGSDAGKVNIETDTGDVEGHFLTSKWFSAHSDTGSVRVPNTRDGGECRIESNTGDIHFE